MNSLKSTGPRTAAGKAISSRNCVLKTGIYAESEVILGENPAHLQALADDYHHRFQPDVPEQRALVDSLIHAEWILRRLRRAEAQLWEFAIHFTSTPNDPGLSPIGRALNADQGLVFSRLQRRLDSTQRNYRQALQHLLQLQADSSAAEPEYEPEPLPVPPLEAVPLGFAPSIAPSVPERPAAVGQDGSLRPSGTRPSDSCSRPAAAPTAL